MYSGNHEIDWLRESGHIIYGSAYHFACTYACACVRFGIGHRTDCVLLDANSSVLGTWACLLPCL